MTRFTKDKADQVSLSDFLKIEKDIYPVGRLDADSEGLLLLTNDKKLTSLIMEPDARKTKTYLVQVDGQINKDAVHQLTKGINIKVENKTYTTKPCEISIIAQEPMLPPRNPPVRFRKNIPTSWLSITLKEGKNRQIRKMCAAAGFPVLRLIRTRIGELSLGNLQPGKHVKCGRDMIYKAFSLPTGENKPFIQRATSSTKPTTRKKKLHTLKKGRN